MATTAFLLPTILVMLLTNMGKQDSNYQPQKNLFYVIALQDGVVFQYGSPLERELEKSPI